MNAEAQPSALRQLVKRSMMRALPPWAFIARGPEDSRVACLTFDDGPHPDHTPPLLDALAAHGVHATFFVVGSRARAHPDLLRRIVDEGHALGHHSYSHGEPESTSARELAAEASETSDIIERLIGARPRLFRPPHGKLTAEKLVRLWAARQTLVLWNVDPRDYLGDARAYFDAQPIAGGDIVLLHDTHPHAAAVIPELSRQARDRGLELAPVTRFTR